MEVRRTVAVAALMASAFACGGGDAPSPAQIVSDAPPAAPAPTAATPPTPEPPPPAPGPQEPACSQNPCAARPVIFVHGQGGSNDDGDEILKAMTSPGERWDSFTWVGTGDHAAWPTRSIPRRAWLFAFDYYLVGGKDGRGKYTAGPGRIGSDPTYACASPPGAGHLVADSSAYDDGVTHAYAADLAAMIEDVLRATGASSVDVVAHSMGGLVLRSFLTFHGGASKVERVLLLASPHLGVTFATAGSFFSGEPWMGAHEFTELDQGSIFAKAQFWRCGAPDDKSSWPKQLLASEAAVTGMPELHCMSGSQDILVSYDAAHHPKCVDHVIVSGADHSGILRASATTDRARLLLGGTYFPKWN